MTEPGIPRQLGHDALPERRIFEPLPTGDDIPPTPDAPPRSPREGQLAEENLALRSLLARYVQRESERIVHGRELEREAAYDPSTGVFKEHIFRTLIEADQRAIAAHRLRNPGAPQDYRTLIAIDFYNQKWVNLRLKRAGGDDVIATVPRLLRRRSDWVTRIGGDEFLVYTDITPQKEGQTPEDVLALQLEYINNQVRLPIIQKYPVLDEGPIRFGIGAGGVIYDHRSGYAANAAVADRALYAVKHSPENEKFYGKFRSADSAG